MNPMPSSGTIPTTPFLVNGYVEFAMVLSVLSLLVVFGMLLWSTRAERRQRVTVVCPLRMRPTSVLFRLGLTGIRTEVIRCAVFGRGAVTCGKACLPRAALV
jgi:hypothetical protein